MRKFQGASVDQGCTLLSQGFDRRSARRGVHRRMHRMVVCVKKTQSTHAVTSELTKDSNHLPAHRALLYSRELLQRHEELVGVLPTPDVSRELPQLLRHTEKHLFSPGFNTIRIIRRTNRTDRSTAGNLIFLSQFECNTAHTIASSRHKFSGDFPPTSPNHRSHGFSTHKTHVCKTDREHDNTHIHRTSTAKTPGLV